MTHVRTAGEFHALEAEAARAEDRAVCTANAVEVGRCWTKSVKADRKMGSLLAAARVSLVATAEDGCFTNDEVWTPPAVRCSTPCSKNVCNYLFCDGI